MGFFKEGLGLLREGGPDLDESVEYNFICVSCLSVLCYSLRLTTFNVPENNLPQRSMP